MHILTSSEEKTFFKERLLTLKEQVLSFMKENHLQGSEKKILYLMRLFLLAQNYHAEDKISVPEIKKVFQDELKLKKYVSFFRKEVQIYQEEIKRIVHDGMKGRKDNKPVYPAFFNGKERVYLKINPVSSGGLYIKDMVDVLNNFLPADEQLNFVFSDDKILIQSEKERKVSHRTLGIKAGRFFKKEASFLTRILTSFSLMSQKEQVDFLSFFNSVGTYSDFKKKYVTFQKFHIDIFPRALMTKTSFYFFKRLGKIASFDEFIFKIKSQRDFYSKIYQNLHHMQTAHQTIDFNENVIDLIILSKSPYDIATMSAYNDYSKNEWASCMTPRGINAHYLPKEIANGVFVCYGVNSKNPWRRLARISIKPYINNQGAVYFGAGYMYGVMSPEAKEQLNTFLSAYQPEKKGCFSLQEDVYKDAVTDKYYFDMSATDIVSEQEIPFKKEPNGTIVVGHMAENTTPFFSKGIDIQNLFFEHHYIPKFEVDLLGIEKNVSFQNMTVYMPFSCYYLTKEKFSILPQHVNELQLTSPHIRDFKGLKTCFYGLEIHLTNFLKSFDGLPKTCSKIQLLRTQIEASMLEIPQSVLSFEAGITTLKTPILDMRKNKGRIEWGESDLQSVKHFLFQREKGEFLLHFTKTAPRLDFDLAGLEKFYFMPLSPVEISSLKMRDNTKKVCFFNVVLKETKLDFSKVEEVHFSHVSFEGVSTLLLPADEKVTISECVFPNGITEKDVLQNKGFCVPFCVDKNKTTLKRVALPEFQRN